MRLPTLLLYALPAIPLAALTLPLYIIVPTFYSETLGLSLAAVGGALLVVRILDAVSDPVIGWLADRFRPAHGRRRVFFAASLPISALAAFMLFWPPVDATPLYLVVWGTVLSVGFTACLLSYQAWGAELAGGYAERARITGFREGFTLVGTLIAIALPFAIGMETASGLHGLAVLGVAVADRACSRLADWPRWRVPEPTEYSVSKLSLGSGLRHMAANGPFVRLIIAYFVNGLANGIPATLFLYFVSQVLAAPDMRGPMLFLYFLAGLAGVPLGVWVSAQDRQAPRLVSCDARQLRDLCARAAARGGRRVVFRRGLRRHGHLPRLRPGSAVGDPGRCHRRRHGGVGRTALGALFRRLEPCDKTVAGARRRHRLSAARRGSASIRRRRPKTAMARCRRWSRSMSGCRSRSSWRRLR